VEKIRTFIAFHLPPDVRGHVEKIQNRFLDQGFRMRRVRPENIHLTLKFLGDIEKRQIETIAGAMTESMKDFSPLHLSAGGIGVFPGIRKARILWCGLKGDTHELIRLQKNLENHLEASGFEKEKRPFRAHMTIARMKESPNPQQLRKAMEESANLFSPPFCADEMILWQSRLRPSGPVYSRLQTIGFTNRY
jgi:2'-5' RNA ligase